MKRLHVSGAQKRKKKRDALLMIDSLPKVTDFFNVDGGGKSAESPIPSSPAANPVETVLSPVRMTNVFMNICEYG